MPDNLVRIGRIVGAFGLKGELKVDPLTDFPEQRFQKGARFRLQGEWVDVEAVRFHKGRPLVTLAGVSSATAAERLQWEYLEATPEERPALEEGEFLVQDLIGMSVVLASGEELGPVDAVLDYPAHEVLKVGELLIPLVAQFVKDVDLPGARITVELIPGMRPGEEG